MNTIIGWQIFSPIPFSEFNPIITKNPPQQYMDINKRQGHFDTYNTEHISFYVKDYVTSKYFPSFKYLRSYPVDMLSLFFHCST